MKEITNNNNIRKLEKVCYAEKKKIRKKNDSIILKIGYTELRPLNLSSYFDHNKNPKFVYPSLNPKFVYPSLIIKLS